MLTLFRCRSSTPLREKARPKRLLAIQCWGKVGVRPAHCASPAPSHPVLLLPPTFQALATYLPQQVPDANDAAQAQAHEVLGVKLIIDDLWAERPGKSTPRGGAAPPTCQPLDGGGHGCGHCQRLTGWGCSREPPQPLHFPRGGNGGSEGTQARPGTRSGGSGWKHRFYTCRWMTLGEAVPFLSFSFFICKMRIASPP